MRLKSANISSTEAPPCGTSFETGEVPATIGNATLTSIPAPAVFEFQGVVYSFGFIGINVGDKAYAEKNPNPPAIDQIAYYQIPTEILEPTDVCSNFGYFYHVNSGLCVTANATSSAGPRFADSELLLEPCGLCAGKPDINQLFCTSSAPAAENRDRPYQCMQFYGDLQDPFPFYGTNYGPGPALAVATLEFGPADCIWLLFPDVPTSSVEPTASVTEVPSSTVAIVPATSTAVSCGGMVYAPGFNPQNIGDSSLTSTPAPAVYVNSIPLTWSFGFNGSNEIGSVAYAEFNPTVPATDKIAYYQVPTSRLPPTTDCNNFGYLYHPDTGMCIEGNVTAGTYPRYEAGELSLQPCRFCGGLPPPEQLFCDDTKPGGSYLPYHCMVFFGDTISTDPFYSINYGDGPSLSVATLSTVIDDCIYLLFPEEPQSSSSVEQVPSSTQVAIPSSTVEILISSTVAIPSATPSIPCSQAAPAPPGSTPATLGNAALFTNPQPATYYDTAFGFLGVSEGSLAYAIYDAIAPAQDKLAFYAVPTSPGDAPQGYIYHIDSGLCATGNRTSDTTPVFQHAHLTLQKCNVCGDQPQPEQLFGIFGSDPGYTCAVLLGEYLNNYQNYYAVDYNAGPDPVVTTVGHFEGSCLFLGPAIV